MSGLVRGGGDDGTRTHDPLLAKQVLFQLSYVPAARRSYRSAPLDRRRRRRMIGASGRVGLNVENGRGHAPLPGPSRLHTDAWRTQIGHPVDPHERGAPVIASLGGTVECIYYAFGKYDVVAIFDMPDNVSAAAFALAVGSTGAISKYVTTPLLTIDEGLAAMGKAGSAGYSPPS